MIWCCDDQRESVERTATPPMTRSPPHSSTTLNRSPTKTQPKSTPKNGVKYATAAPWIAGARRKTVANKTKVMANEGIPAYRSGIRSPKEKSVSDHPPTKGTMACRQQAEINIWHVTSIRGLISRAAGRRLFKTAPRAQLMPEIREKRIPRAVLPDPNAGIARKTAPRRPMSRPL